MGHAFKECSGAFVVEDVFFFLRPKRVSSRDGEPSSPIRVHLERPTSFELTQSTVNDVTRVDGEMVRREAGDVILPATWLDAVTGVGFDGEGWTLRIPETNVTALELKRISWGRPEPPCSAVRS